MTDIKEKYNYNLERIDKAFSYFDREDISIDDKEKQLENFNQLMKEQNELMYKLKLRAGDIEVLEGYRLSIRKEKEVC